MSESLSQVARLAAVGAAFVTLRSFVTQLIGLAGMVVLAHQLSPREFGLIAFGLAITVFATAFADVGLAAGLIRSPTAPTRRALRNVLGLQVVAMTTFAVLVSAVVLPFGRVGEVTALMLCSLPLTAWQTPARVVLERNLSYKSLSAIELAQSIAYWSTAVIAVESGLGVWGVAGASVVQTAVGTGLLLWKIPTARLSPAFRFRESRALVQFGAAFQAVNLTNLIRDQGLNFAVAAILGLPALGVWNVAARVLRAPLTLFGAVWRVSYPSMVQVVRMNPKPRDLLERAVTVSALCCGLILVPLAAGGVVLVPLVFGSEWREAGYVLVPASAALMIGGPVSLSVAGYLYAIGSVRTMVWSAVLHTAAWFALALPLLPVMGVPAVGIGLLAGSAVDAVVLGGAVNKATDARVLQRLLSPLLAGVIAAAMSLWLALSWPATALLAVLVVTSSVVFYVAILGLSTALRPGSDLADGVRLLTSTIVTRVRAKTTPSVSPQLDAHLAP